MDSGSGYLGVTDQDWGALENLWGVISLDGISWEGCVSEAQFIAKVAWMEEAACVEPSCPYNSMPVFM